VKPAPLLVFSALLVPSSASSAEPAWTVRFRTFGPIRFGSTVAVAERALGARLRVTGPWAAEEPCHLVRSVVLPPSADLMVEDGRVVRVDIDDPSVRTLHGVGVGSTEAEVRAVYGDQLEISPRPYAEDVGLWMELVPRRADNRGTRIVFATLEGRVTSIHAGLVPAVGYVESCS
jgi:hypothetical protein